jgi:hypothetical protein
VRDNSTDIRCRFCRSASNQNLLLIVTSSAVVGSSAIRSLVRTRHCNHHALLLAARQLNGYASIFCSGSGMPIGKADGTRARLAVSGVPGGLR